MKRGDISSERVCYDASESRRPVTLMGRNLLLLLNFQSCQSDDDDAPTDGEINETIFHNKFSRVL
jgi:hypothetical protein